jgi:hypothetical protein
MCMHAHLGGALNFRSENIQSFHSLVLAGPLEYAELLVLAPSRLARARLAYRPYLTRAVFRLAMEQLLALWEARVEYS